ncbi:MAG: ATP-binding cassette domain-containing protein [Oligoflexia bacterium]|nr:ATP-binding cassette domain-containing protein [Oligoflexia bacterium]
MTNSSNDVLLEDACKVYGKDTLEEFRPFAPVSFQLKDKELLYIIGANGSGKTTLLRAIADLTTIEEGRLTQNHDVNFLSSNESQMFDQLTGLENIKYFLGLRNQSFDQQKIINRWQEVPAFNKALHTKYNLCSKGMKRILDLCVAFEDCGSLVLLDEPFHGLDSENRDAIINIINQDFLDKTIIITAQNIPSQSTDGAFNRSYSIFELKGVNQ